MGYVAPTEIFSIERFVDPSRLNDSCRISQSIDATEKLAPLARTCAGGYGLFISIQVRNDDKTMYTISS